jgi:hypothetical protein
MLQPPKVDRRTAEDLVTQVLARLPQGATSGAGGNIALSLINVFARFGQIIIERMNKAPQKNLLAFLDLLGISRLPPQAARAPLTFYMASENPGNVTVLLGTQVASPPAKGEQQPVVYETAYELVVVSAKLESLLARESTHDQYTVFDAALAQGPPGSGSPAVASAPSQSAGEVRLLPHILYIGIKTYPHWPKINQLRLKFNLEEDGSGPRDARIVRWEACAALPAPGSSNTPAQLPPARIEDESFLAIELTPILDDTNNLMKSGDVVFLNTSEVPALELEGTTSRWLRCRLMTPIARQHEPVLGMVRHTHLPRIKSVDVEIRLERKGLAMDQAFTNQQKLDATKDFLPFGEKPKFGDTLYLANELVFSNPDAFITLHIALTNPASGTSEGLPPSTPHGTKLRWEFWDGQAWVELGTAEMSRRVRISQEPSEGSATTEFSDTTQTLSETGTVSFRFNRIPQPCEVNGQKSYWIRVRIVAGDYGKDIRYERDPVKGYVAVPATLSPPSIHSITIDYAVDRTTKPEALIAYNNFFCRHIVAGANPFEPFIPAPEDHAVYFGFNAPAPQPGSRGEAGSKKRRTSSREFFPNRSMSIYVALAEEEEKSLDAVNQEPSVWDYWNGSAWTKWTVRDDTQGLRRSGLIRVLAPPDHALKNEFGVERYWLRLFQKPDRPTPRLRRVLLNTTLAKQVSTFLNEVLGTSNGKPRQKFQVTHGPVLTGQRLEVRELAEPPLHELIRLKEDEGDDAITKVKRTSAKGDDIWVRWHEVPNFYGSSPRDRHYVLDRLAGAVIFGDGVNGLIPPVLPANIRMSSYQSGGGSSGNKPAGVIAQLKTAVPYIGQVINWEPATGGAEAEAEADLLERGTRVLRHNHRAVTVEDFEDLAVLASPGVARAKCVSNHDLTEDPLCRHRRPGIVSIIVVPRSAEPRPRPSAALLSDVRSFLEDHCAPTVAGMILLGPVYVTLDVTVEIAVNDIGIAGDVELAVTLALMRFLHPLTGGREETGWHFGARPHRSDLFSLLEHVPGVSHVRSLEMLLNGGKPEQMAWSLLCYGQSRVTTVVEE